jgi:hypothetical protein
MTPRAMPTIEWWPATKASGSLRMVARRIEDPHGRLERSTSAGRRSSDRLDSTDRRGCRTRVMGARRHCLPYGTAGRGLRPGYSTDRAPIQLRGRVIRGFLVVSPTVARPLQCTRMAGSRSPRLQPAAPTSGRDSGVHVARQQLHGAARVRRCLRRHPKGLSGQVKTLMFWGGAGPPREAPARIVTGRVSTSPDGTATDAICSWFAGSGGPMPPRSRCAMKRCGECPCLEAMPSRPAHHRGLARHFDKPRRQPESPSMPDGSAASRG